MNLWSTFIGRYQNGGNAYRNTGYWCLIVPKFQPHTIEKDILKASDSSVSKGTEANIYSEIYL